MTDLKTVLAGASLGMAAMALAASAHAFVLVEDSGWQTDQISTAGAPSDSSPVTFTCSAGDAPCVFSLTDAFLHGDTYTVTVNGGASYSSTLGAVNTNFDVVPNNFGPFAGFYAGPFVDPTYSHLQLTLTPGAYSLVITGDGAGGIPAGFGYRLDSLVPEPTAWALMLLGLGLVGLATRRRAVLARPV